MRKTELICSLVVLVGMTAMQGFAIAETERTGPAAPCHAEAAATAVGDVLPDCDEFGFYVPKQCDPEHSVCWCVTRCGLPRFETKGGSDLDCEQDIPPCLKEKKGIAGRPRFGRYKPRCHSDGFYHHTQCFGSICWCTDRCGNEVESSKHAIGTLGVCECLDGDYAWNCKSNPCESAECPAHLDAICKPSMCGGCVAKFYLADKEVNCDLPLPLIVKIDVHCTDYDGNRHNNGDRWKVDKCIECECSQGIEICMSPSCAGPPMGWEHCKVKDGMENVCCPDFDCLGCLDQEGDHYQVGESWYASGDPCESCICLDNQEVSCSRERCRGVNRYIPPRCEWVIFPGDCCPRDDGPSGVVCHEPIHACPPGSAVTPECPSHLCLTATCEAHPNARCRISHCGTCHTVFYDNDDVKVDCAEEPISSEPVCDGMVLTCLVEPCAQSNCTNHPGSTCYTDFCDQCTPLFFDNKNNKLECDPPVQDMCDETHYVGDGWEDGCMTCECTMYLSFACIPKECGDPPSTLPNERCYWAKQTPDECCPTKMVCEEAISDCPAGFTVARSCPADLCDTTCLGHPEATCRICRCGGCFAKFFDENNQAVDCEGEPVAVQPECLSDQEQVTCLVSPCLFASCQYYPNAVCHHDYCRQCEVVYYDASNKLLDCLLEIKEDTVECKDSSRNKHDVGDTWMQGCIECTCHADGIPSCIEKTCDTEIDIHCTDYDGSRHNNGDRWKVDKCIECECIQGIPVCMSPGCAGPPMGWEHCKVKDGMENVCCPDFDCLGCLDQEGDHYQVGESWYASGDPCESCICLDNQEVSCSRERCRGVNRYIPPRCEWVIFPGDCCPRDDGPSGVVCHEPIYACPPGSAVTPECPSHLCLTATCEAHPNARCRISHCGTCHTVFYDNDDVKVDCAEEPISSEPVCDGMVLTCLVEPCAQSNCTNHPGSTCYTDFCDQCTPLFFDNKNNKLECDPPVQDMCDETHYVGDGWEDGCMTCECTMYLTLACIPKECGDPPSTLPNERCYWAKQTPDECCPTKMVCEEAISDCPAGFTVARSCPADLCDTTCLGHPEATCLISRCGGCFAKFFDENNQAVDCEGEPVAVQPECLSDQEQMTCLVSPCLSASCQYYPNAVCHHDYCRQCEVVYYDASNKLLDCLLEIKEDTVECKDSSRNKHDVGDTWMQGCIECTCHADGIPSCIEKTCDTDMCDETHYVGDGWEDGCMTCLCTTDLTLACIANECGEPPSTLPNERCYWAKQTPDECCPTKMVCEEAISACPFSGAIASSCPADLCDTTCLGHPEATCLISRCGGCFAKFFDENDQAVDCEGEPVGVQPVCSAQLPVIMCFASPCDHGTCESHPDAVCHVRYCQPCDAVYYDDNNRELDCISHDKEDKIECKDSNNNKHDAGETWTEGCMDCICEDSGLATCKATKCAITEGNLPPLCQLVKEESDTCCPGHLLCHEALSSCPPFASVADTCPEDLCVNAVCDAHPTATCRVSRCGGCSAKFFDENDELIPECVGELIDSSLLCPDTEPVVMCFVSPCALTTCEAWPESVCHVDYCQPCTAVFYDKENNLQDCTSLPDPQPECNPHRYLSTQEGTVTLPRCLRNGDFSPKQCDTTGHCWCVNPDGSTASVQPVTVPGKEFICESAPPCRAVLKANSLKAQRGEPVTPDPVCDPTGWFEPEQCCPESSQCWCSLKDGTMVTGSNKPHGEPLNCNSPCLGDTDIMYPLLQCSNQRNYCPGDSFCHIPPNRTIGKCCRFPGMSSIP